MQIKYDTHILRLVKMPAVAIIIMSTATISLGELERYSGFGLKLKLEIKQSCLCKCITQVWLKISLSGITSVYNQTSMLIYVLNMVLNSAYN